MADTEYETLGNCYIILNLEESATTDQIKAAYRDNIKESEEIFKKVSGAYRTLCLVFLPNVAWISFYLKSQLFPIEILVSFRNTGFNEPRISKCR